MEDEILKSRTDCVYFLASPLTCKKGSECEFRHNENARLNPRDCWYWLNGNCINPNCSFRHPPLEGLTEPVRNSVQLPTYHTVPTSKSNIPCYFYFNAYCIKGDQCAFLHDMSPAQKFPKAASEPTTNPPEIKTSTESDTGPASVEVPANPSEGTSELVKQYNSKEVRHPAQGSVLGESSPSAESSVPECEEPAIKLPDSPLPPVEYRNGSDEHLSPGQSSEELVKESNEPDEWWESSPGFDVLVDDGSEQLAYQDDAEYLLARERESEMLHSHLLHYDFEGSTGYDPMAYPDAGYLYDHSAYDSYDCLENRHTYDSHDRLENRHTPEYFQRDSEQSRERFLEPKIHRKRKLSHRECEVDVRGGMDICDHPRRKHRRLDGRQVCQNFRKHHSRTRGNSRERSVRHGMGPLLPGRLASEVGKNMIGSSHGESESLRNDRRMRGWSGYPQPHRHSRSRHRERESRRHAKPPRALSSEFSQGSASKEAKSTRVMTAGFTGPKTLGQIREEKSGAKADRDGTGSHMLHRSRRPMSEDFEGPKPLSELLKDKRRHVPASGNTNGPASTTSRQERFGFQTEKRDTDAYLEEDSFPSYRGTAGKQDREYDSDFVDDDDDDGLRKKLAHILSQ